MSKRILVVDDEPVILNAINRALSKVGYEITAVRDGSSCMEALLTGDFGLVIMDLHLPGSSTEELAASALARCPGIKFLYISGGFGRKDAVPFIQKPFRINDMRDMVRTIIGDPDRN